MIVLIAKALTLFHYQLRISSCVYLRLFVFILQRALEKRYTNNLFPPADAAQKINQRTSSGWSRNVPTPQEFLKRIKQAEGYSGSNEVRKFSFIQNIFGFFFLFRTYLFFIEKFFKDFYTLIDLTLLQLPHKKTPNFNSSPLYTPETVQERRNSARFNANRSNVVRNYFNYKLVF